MTPRRNDHITIIGRTMMCRHCGGRVQMVMPQVIEVVLERMNQFIAEHQDCPKPQEAVT